MGVRAANCHLGITETSEGVLNTVGNLITFSVFSRKDFVRFFFMVSMCVCVFPQKCGM